MRKRRIPFVQQLEISDCGAACLAMAFRFHGIEASREDVREATGTDASGVSALSLARTARAHGLEARGVRVTPETISLLPRGSILHWEGRHFVVYDGVTRRGIQIIDPAVGKRVVPVRKFFESFTGVAVEIHSQTKARPARQQTNSWRPLIALLKNQRGALARLLVVSATIQVFVLAVPLVTALVVDDIVPRRDVDLLRTLALGAGAVGFAYFGFAVARNLFLVRLRTLLDTQLTINFLEHLASLPYGFFLRRSTGDLMARVNSNTVIRETLTAGALSTLLDGLLASLYLVLLLAADLTLGLVVAAIAALQIGVMLRTRERYQLLMAENLEAQAKTQSRINGFLTGIESLKAMAAEHIFTERLAGYFVEETNANAARGRFAGVVEAALATLQVSGPVLVLLVGSMRVLDGDLSLGGMLGVNALAAAFLLPLANFIMTSREMQLLASYLERINDVLEHPTDREHRTASVPLADGSITLSDVSFSYGPLRPPVVVDVSLHVEDKEHVAIVGPSGSGKSTLVRLVAGVLRSTEGRVEVGGIDTGSADPVTLRAGIAMVVQQPYLFAMTIRENLSLAVPNATDDDIERATRIAHIHDDIMALPNGYLTGLSDGGASLSGGQRQRIALARAILAQPRVLILDEATSALDSRTEDEVYAALAALSCTKVVVAHRISTIRRAHQIFVMDSGRIVEHGSDEALRRAGGIYHDLALRSG